MTDYNISVVVDSDTEGLASGADQAAGAITELGAQAESAGGQVDSGMTQAASGVSGLGDAATEASGTVTSAMDDATAAVDSLATSADSGSTDVAGSLGSMGSAAGDAASDFADGTDAMASALDDLQLNLDTTVSEMSTTLTTDVPAATDTAVASISTKAGKFKAVGAAVGNQVAAGISSGVSAPDAVSSVGNSITGLIATSARSSGGIITAVGLGLAAALFNSLITRSEEAKKQIEADIKDWSAAYIDGLGRITKATRASLIEGAFADPDSVLNKIRDEFGSLAEDSINLVGKALFGTPGDQQQALDTLLRQHAAMRDQYDLDVASGKLSSEELAKEAVELNDHFQLIETLKDEVGLRGEGRSEAEKVIGVLRHTNSLTREQKAVTDGLVRSTEQYAALMERAAAAAEAIGAGLNAAATASGIIGDTQ